MTLSGLLHFYQFCLQLLVLNMGQEAHDVFSLRGAHLNHVLFSVVIGKVEMNAGNVIIILLILCLGLLEQTGALSRLHNQARLACQTQL